MPDVNESDVEAFIAASRALVGVAIRSINAAPVEITLPQHRVMVLLAGGPQNIGRLAEQLGIDQSNASRLCDRLQKLGLISRVRSRADRRAVDASLTEPGIELLDAVNGHRRVEVGRILAAMSTQDVRAAVRALGAFAEAAHETAEHDWAVHTI